MRCWSRAHPLQPGPQNHDLCSLGMGSSSGRSGGGVWAGQVEGPDKPADATAGARLPGLLPGLWEGLPLGTTGVHTGLQAPQSPHIHRGWWARRADAPEVAPRGCGPVSAGCSSPPRAQVSCAPCTWAGTTSCTPAPPLLHHGRVSQASVSLSTCPCSPAPEAGGAELSVSPSFPLLSARRHQVPGSWPGGRASWGGGSPGRVLVSGEAVALLRGGAGPPAQGLCGLLTWPPCSTGS